MKPLLISLNPEYAIEKYWVEQGQFELCECVVRDYPDGETYVRLMTNVQNREVVILQTLDRPNSHIMPLLFIAETTKKLGAARVGLCAPYLAYMRQDKQFQPGEGITSRYFAHLLSQYFDFMLTVDPHLHRYHNLNEIYSIPAVALHAAPSIVNWITQNVENGLVIGPDAESEQWVLDVAEKASISYVILEKTRRGDSDVSVKATNITNASQYTPILIDDIISTGQTLIAAILQVQENKMPPPICIGVHAVFAGDAYANILQAGVKQIVTCNTISHSTNQIDLAPLLLQGIKDLLAE